MDYGRETLDHLEKRASHDYARRSSSPRCTSRLATRIAQSTGWRRRTPSEEAGWLISTFIRVLDTLRSEPRFKVLVRKMGL